MTLGTAVMFGAGNVGRGFLGQLFSESGYEVVFTDIDQVLIDTLNREGRYTIQLVENDWSTEVRVAPVRGLHPANKEAVIEAVVQAGIAATAVGARALKLIAPLIAAGIMKRRESGITEPLNFIICENLKDAAATFKGMVAEAIPAGYQDYFEESIGFVDTVIGRMVPPPTPEMRAADPARIMVEPYKVLPVDRAGFIGPAPKIVGMEVCDNFPVYTARKLYLHNCGHAILGYLGYRRGHLYGYQALEDGVIRKVFEAALGESVAGIVAAYGVEKTWLDDHQVDLTRRFANRTLGDTSFRLGRDPIRKLAYNDRLVGSARLAEKAGVEPVALSWGIAAGYAFDAAEDPVSQELQEMLKQNGLSDTLAKVSAIQPGEELADLVMDRYRRLAAGDWPG